MSLISLTCMVVLDDAESVVMTTYQKLFTAKDVSIEPVPESRVAQNLNEYT